MSWVTLTDYDLGVNLDDKPRKLTPSEINYITSHLPIPPSADNASGALSRDNIIEWMTETLKDVELCPSAINELIAEIVNQHNKSLVIPGTPIGITAAEAVGASATQMTLNSVAPWERLIVQDPNGTPYLLKIGQWIDALLNCYPSKIQHIPENRTEYLELPYPVTIASPDENGKVTWEKITAVTRHLPVGDMVKIITRSGREVTATQSKSLLIWDGDRLIQKEGRLAKVGDRVPVFANVNDPPIEINTLNLRNYLSPKEWLYGSELQSLYNDYKGYNTPGKHRFWSIKSRLDNLPYARGDSALLACRTGLDTGKIKSGFIYPKSWSGSGNTIVPENIPLTKEFGQIVGLYLAEGLCTDTFVGISNNSPEIRDLVYKWCDSVGITYHTTVTESFRGTSTDTNIHSVLLARFFKKWMNTGSANKIIPPEVLLGPKQFIIGVLDGYFAGDGTVNERDDYLCISSASKDLITGFGFLCSRVGIFGKQSGHQPKSNNIGSKNIKYVNTYSIRNKNAYVWATTIGSCMYEKDDKMQKIIDNNVDKEWGIYYQKHNDVMLDPIVSVELVPATEYVYDLTIPTTTNFSLWNGLGVADTFHSSGSSKSASFGIDALRDLIFARKSPKNEGCTIYFSNKQITFEEVLNARQYIIGSVVSDFVKDYDIKTPEILSKFWWHDQSLNLLDKEIPPSSQVLRLHLNIAEMFKHRVDIKTLASVLEREVPPSLVAVYGPIGDAIIDLYPRPTLISETLKNYNMTIDPELAELTYLESVVRPELSNIRVKGIVGIKNLYPIVSPVWRMVLYERKITANDMVSVDQLQLLSNYLKDNNGFILFYNLNIMKMTGLIPENLAALCNEAGVNVIAKDPKYLIVSMPNDRFRTESNDIVYSINQIKYLRYNIDNLANFDNSYYKSITHLTVEPSETGWVVTDNNMPVGTDYLPDDIRQINNTFYLKLNNIIIDNSFVYEPIYEVNTKIKELLPSEYITNKIQSDKRSRNDQIKRLTDVLLNDAQQLPEPQRSIMIRKPVNVPRTPLMMASEFVIAETEGSNLRELLALPGIDKNRTTCNNMFTITTTLGIEATRTFFIRALTNTIANTGSYVNPSNIMLIAEFITSRGEPYGATYTGISRQPGGHLSLATLERAGKVFSQSALHGRKEDIRNVSASVAVGARMAIGDGSFDIAQDIVQNGVPKTIINDDLFTGLENDDTTIAQKNKQPEVISPDDLTDGLDLLNKLNIGQTFDYTGAEDEANLLTLFTSTEVISDLPVNRVTTAPQTLNRRVQPKINTAEIPDTLVDVLSQIKIGVPSDTFTEPVTITPLTNGIQPLAPIVSTGLIPLDELIPKNINSSNNDPNNQLADLFSQFNIQNTQDPLPPNLTIGAVDTFLSQFDPANNAIPLDSPLYNEQPLPQFNLDDLPSLEGFDPREALRNQISTLEPINTQALQNTLNR